MKKVDVIFTFTKFSQAKDSKSKNKNKNIICIYS